MEQVRVVLTGLEDTSESGIAQFAEDLSRTFHIPIDKAEAIARSRPYTVKKACDPEMADRLAHTLGRLGAVLSIEPVSPPPAQGTAEPPTVSAQEAASEPNAAASMGTIPLARPAVPESPAPAGGEDPAASTDATPVSMGPTVTCTECGTSQPIDGKACSNCYFPLPVPNRRDPVHAGEEEADESIRPRGPVVFSDVADGFGELQQCAPTVICAAGLLFGAAFLNLWTFAFLSDLTGPAGIVSGLIDIVLGIGLLRGNASARTWVLVRAVLGGFLWGLIALGTGDIGSFFFQELYSVSLILLLIGHGSLLKAVLVGIPNALIFGLALVGLVFMTMAGGVPGNYQSVALIHQADALVDQGRYQAAVPLYRQALQKDSVQNDEELQATAYRKLAEAYMGMEDFVSAIPQLQSSITLREENAEAHYMLAICYFQSGQGDRAMNELERVRELDPDYPGLEKSMRAVRTSQGY